MKCDYEEDRTVEIKLSRFFAIDRSKVRSRPLTHAK